MFYIDENGKEWFFKTYKEFLDWQDKIYKERKEREEREWREERERKLARLTEEDKKEIEKLELEKDRIHLSTDFLDEIDRANIDEINRQIRKIRGF